MFIYCPQCQNLIEKVGTENNAPQITRTCVRCGKKTVFTLRYKAVNDKRQFDDTKK